MKPLVFPQRLIDAREQHVAECLIRSAISGGGIVLNEPAPGSIDVVLFRSEEDAEFVGSNSVAVYCRPEFPSPEMYASLNCFDLVAVPSLPVADKLRPLLDGPRVEPFGLPIDSSLLDAKSEVGWLDWNSSGYRVYAVVPEHEIGVLYPLVKAYFDEYRSTDAVTLLIRSTAPRAEVQDIISYTSKEVGLTDTQQPRLRMALGKWSAKEQAMLAVWGDCLLLPWAGCDFPIELSYAMSQGNFVAAPEWCAGAVLSARCGSLLNYSLGEPGSYAEMDWSQVSSVMRLAVAGGRSVRVPSQLSARELFCDFGHFFEFLMAKLGRSNDCEGREILCKPSSSVTTTKEFEK